jgi:hypothetical protein
MKRLRVITNRWTRRPNAGYPKTPAMCCRCNNHLGDSYTVNAYQTEVMSAPAYYYYCDECMRILASCYHALHGFAPNWEQATEYEYQSA